MDVSFGSAETSPKRAKSWCPREHKRSRACALHGVTGQTTRWWTYAWTSSCVRGATENEEEIERISSDSAQFSVDTPVLHVHNISCISYHMAAPFRRVSVHAHLHFTAQSPHHQSLVHSSGVMLRFAELCDTYILVVQSVSGRCRGCGLNESR